MHWPAHSPGVLVFSYPKMTTDNTNVPEDMQTLKFELEMLKKANATLEEKSVLKDVLIRVYEEENTKYVNVRHCVFMRTFLHRKWIRLFDLSMGIKQMIKWILPANLFVELIFLHLMCIPFIAIFCVAFEIWSKQTVTQDVMLTAMKTTLELVMTPGMMVWNNIKQFVCDFVCAGYTPTSYSNNGTFYGWKLW